LGKKIYIIDFSKFKLLILPDIVERTVGRAT
jgi:hypothetical protein